MDKKCIIDSFKELIKLVGGSVLLTITANLIIFIYNYIQSVIWNIDISFLGFGNASILLKLSLLILFLLISLFVGYRFTKSFCMETNLKIELYKYRQNSTNKDNSNLSIDDYNNEKRQKKDNYRVKRKSIIWILLFSLIPFFVELIVGYFRNLFICIINGIFFFVVLLTFYTICCQVILRLRTRKLKSLNYQKGELIHNSISFTRKFIYCIVLFIIIIVMCIISCLSSITNNFTYYIYEDETTNQTYAVVFINDNDLVMEEVSISEDNTIHFYTAYQLFTTKYDVRLQKRTFKSKSIDYKTTENKNTYEVVTPYLFGIIQLPFSC